MYFGIDGTNVRILGSMHRVPAEYPDLPPWVWAAYKWADSIVFEHEIDVNLLYLMTLPNGQQLQEKLTPQLYAKLKAVWPDYSPDGKLYNQKLWYVAAKLAQQGVALADGVEPTFLRQVITDGKPVRYLEKSTEFVALADSVGDSRYSQLIERQLAQQSQSEMVIREMYAAWISQRLNAFEALFPRLLIMADPVIKQAAIDKRNAAWVPQIVELSKVKSPKKILVVVGALHLPGRNGVLSMLEFHGCQITSVLS